MGCSVRELHVKYFSFIVTETLLVGMKRVRTEGFIEMRLSTR